MSLATYTHTHTHAHARARTHRLKATDTKRCQTKMRAALKAVLQPAAGDGLKIQFKPAPSPVGAKEYICKEHAKPHFQAVDGEGHEFQGGHGDEVFKLLGDEWHRYSAAQRNSLAALSVHTGLVHLGDQLQLLCAWHCIAFFMLTSSQTHDAP